MQNSGKIGVQFNKMEKILKEVRLFSERNYFPSVIENNLSEIRKLDYVGIWKYYLSNSHFNFQLIDNSLLSFKLDLTKPSFSFLGCPYDCLTYKDFLIENDFSFEEVGESFYSEYENYLDSCPLLIFPNTIRYDYDTTSYNEGIHPISHFHIGHNNQIRIGIKFKLDPFAFFCFIIRQIYPNEWDMIISNPKFENDIEMYKEKISQIEAIYYNRKDKFELYLK